MAWTVTTLSDNTEHIILSCVQSATSGGPIIKTIDISGFSGGVAEATVDGVIITSKAHIEWVEWSIPPQISSSASGVLTIGYKGSATQPVLELSGSGSMGVHSTGIIAKELNDQASGYVGDIVLSVGDHQATVVLCLRKVSGFTG